MAEDLLSIYERLRKKSIRESNLNALAVELRPYDLVDLLSKIGALSCMPENASHAVRLEALAAAAITNPHDPNKSRISKVTFQQIVNRYLGLHSSVTQLEDSCVNLFTESITFFDGDYVVFPGLLAFASFILRNICKGLFLGRESIEDEAFKSSAYFELKTSLVLSNEIARRANLTRGIRPSTITWNENIKVPKNRLLRELQASVTFSENELEQIFARTNIPLACLEPYLSTPGTEHLSGNDLDSSGIYTKPIARIDDKYIVLVPGLLVSAAIHRVLSLAVKLGAESELTEAYRAATWDSIQSSLMLLDTFPISRPALLGTKRESQWLECCYQFDTDKLLYIQYFTDDLEKYDVDNPFSRWVIKRASNIVVERQKKVTDRIYQELPGINEIAWLMLIQGYGRSFQFQLQMSKLKCPTIALTAAELEVIGFSERGDRMALWKYLEHKIQTRRHRPVISTGEIDEFEFYRSNMHSYPLPDDIHGVILIKAGTGGELIRKVYSELDLHGVIGDQPHTTAEVISSPAKDFPVSTVSALSHSKDHAAIIVEQFHIPVWIVGQKYTDPSEYAALHPIYTLFMDSIGYWLWQSKDFTANLVNSLSSKVDRLLIEMCVQPSETWRQLPLDYKEPGAREGIKDHILVKTYGHEGKIRIEIRESLKTWLVTQDNRVERGLMQSVFQSLRDLNQELIGSPNTLPTNEDIVKAIDAYIPLGMKKTMLMIPIQDPRLDDKLLPEVRLIQEADEMDVSGDIRKYLISSSFPSGVLKSTKSKTDILNGIVRYLYEELVAAVSSLKSADLLEFLMAQHEAIVHEYYTSRLRIPLQLGSFYSSQELVSRLAEETPKMTQTSVALRFLIEYISARPPKGWRPISYEVFDRLIALCAEIVTLGTISDRIHYEIDDTSIEIRSGFLQVAQDSFYAALRSFIPNYFEELIGNSVKRFGEPWRIMKYAEPRHIQIDSDEPFDKAFLAEFGLSFSDYQRICGQIMVLGYEQDNPAKYMPEHRLVTEVSKETRIPYDIVLRTIDSITLKERRDYLEPPDGYDDWEVYPWQFNRNLSFLRKPLISVRRGEERGILWGTRHLIHSVEFLYGHCYSGKLKANSQIMRGFISNARNEDGTAFTDEVYDVFIKYSALTVRRRIEKFCGREMYDHKGKLGDVDVLAVDNSKSEILIIECKNLNAALSSYEYNNELKSLFVDRKEDCEATKLLRRKQWVEHNIRLVSTELNLSYKKDWKYRPLIVTSEELFTPYLHKTAVETISLRRLIEEFLPCWIQHQAERNSPNTVNKQGTRVDLNPKQSQIAGQ